MIPVMSRLMGKAKKLCASKPAGFQKIRAEPLVVIVVPTRELAMQTWDEARRMCYRSMLRPCVVYGGMPMGMTFDDLGKGCDVLVATPGRLCDLMDKPHILSMSRVKYASLRPLATIRHVLTSLQVHDHRRGRRDAPVRLGGGAAQDHVGWR